MMLFTERAELAEEVIQWMEENNVANTPLSVISYLDAIGALQQSCEKVAEGCDDYISRQAAIDIERNATVDTNPSHFEAHQKFTQFMDDAEISSFGRWQWSNGFNTALTAVGIDLKKLPSAQPEKECEKCIFKPFKQFQPEQDGFTMWAKSVADSYRQPERKKGEWIIDKDCEGKSRTVTCNLCGHKEFNWHDPNFCPNCGAEMEGENL